VDFGFGGCERAVPPEELNRGRGETGWQVKASRRVDHVPLGHELNVVALDFDQPAMMREPRLAGTFLPHRGFKGPRRHFDVPAFAHPHQLRTDPQRIANIFQGMRADDEIELVVIERPSAAIANIALDPRVAAKPLAIATLRGGTTERAVEPSGLVGLRVDHPLSPIERTGPGTHVQDDVRGTQELQKRARVLVVQKKGLGPTCYIRRIEARFVLSAASASDFPRTGLPEIAMVGRSNVGKSSLINALVKQKVARTSAAAGKTRLANYYLVDQASDSGLRARSQKSGAWSPFYLVDLPGYGYARGGRESAETFELLTQQYFAPSTRTERHIAGIFQFVDARHPDLPQDAAAHEWVFRTRIPVAIVASKIDKLTRAEKTRALRTLETKYETIVLAESALDGTGLDEIWTCLRGWIS
jgi:GTP-binding protein